MLEVSALRLSYGRALVLEDVSFDVAPAEVVAVIGPNGAGKSSMLRAVSGLHAYAGAVRFGDRSLAGLRPDAIVGLGLLHCPQAAQLFGDLSVSDNLDLGAYRRGKRRGDAELRERVYALFPRLAERSRQRASTLSGGERQMLAVGRSLMGDPAMLMLDEPSQGLAPSVRDAIEQSLRRIIAEWHLTILLVEQDTGFALGLADRVLIMDAGRIVGNAPPDRIREDDRLREAYLGVV